MIKKILNDPVFYAIVGLGRILPDTVAADAVYLKLLYRNRMGKKLNLERPETYNEKLQWMKLYNRDPKYTMLVDKEAVKAEVEKKVGSKYIIPTLGVWERFEDIDFSKLPERFVLKCTHDSGGLVICKDKATLDLVSARKKIEHCMKRNYYLNTREWPYKNVPRKIIAEQYISCADGAIPLDYKFYCFSGKIDSVMVCVGREFGHPTFFYYDLDWNRKKYQKPGIEPSLDESIPRPENFAEMIEVVQKLAKGYPEVRIDLYNIDGKIYFGEYTFFNQSGFDREITEETNHRWGKMIIIPADKGK